MSTDPIHTPQEAAEYVRLKERTLADWRYRGCGPRYIRISGRTVRYRQSDLDAWLATRTRTSTSASDAA
jgi:excisionase family DNA binding protein